MLRESVERLKKANAKQLETIRAYDRLHADSIRGFVRNRLVIILLTTLLLTIADGILTIHLLNLGAWEANPLMRFALSVSLEFFIGVKYHLTAGGLFILLRFGKVAILDESITLQEIALGVILFYQGLVIYEIECYMILS
jgi:hypothetical protein